MDEPQPQSNEDTQADCDLITVQAESRKHLFSKG